MARHNPKARLKNSSKPEDRAAFAAYTQYEKAWKALGKAVADVEKANVDLAELFRIAAEGAKHPRDASDIREMGVLYGQDGTNAARRIKAARDNISKSATHISDVYFDG